MGANVSTVFNVVILVFILFEILNSVFDAKSKVSSIRLPKSFVLSGRESYAAYEKTLDALADLHPSAAAPDQLDEDLSLTVAYSEYTNPDRPVRGAGARRWRVCVTGAVPVQPV